VLAHLRPLPQLVSADWRRRPVPPEGSVPGTARRQLLLAGTIVAGAVLAVATVRYAQPWVHWFAGGRGGEG
jgi:hypothetical protein